jgi:uncharacterized protein (DUF362 family)
MGAGDLVSGKRVLIKPNLTVNMSADTGVTTHPRMVESAARCLIELGAREVIVGEGSATRVGPAFEKLGYNDLAEDLGVKLVDFWEDEYVDVRVPKPLSLQSLRIAKTVLDADLMLNMPVLKIHGGESQVTLCAKNMMGCISGSKSFMHQDFNAKIIDLLQVVRPDLNIVDGIVGMAADGLQTRRSQARGPGGRVGIWPFRPVQHTR